MLTAIRRKRPLRWSIANWLKGYKFGPVQRFRCCDHTTPFHYLACPRRGGGRQ